MSILEISKQPIPRELHGQRLDQALASLYPEFSRSQLAEWVKEEQITVNAKPCKPKDKVCAGDLLDIHISTSEISKDFSNSPAENIPLDIVYEDESILIINKPAGLVVHPGAGNKEHTLVNALLYHDPELRALPRAGIIHRLDKDTTGLLVIAKTLIAHTALIRQMQAREINRHYLTLVQGHVISGGTIETYFGRHSKNRLKMAVCIQGKEAITEYAINTQYYDFTLLNVKLMTGRTHQIRVHMAHINHPVVGDKLYGWKLRLPAQASDNLRQCLSQFSRQALHACELSLMHPITGKPLTFKADLPDDFNNLLSALDNYYDNEVS